MHVSQGHPGNRDTGTRQAAGNQAAVVTQDPRGSPSFAKDKGPEVWIGAGQTSQQRRASRAHRHGDPSKSAVLKGSVARGLCVQLPYGI